MISLRGEIDLSLAFVEYSFRLETKKGKDYVERNKTKVGEKVELGTTEAYETNNDVVGFELEILATLVNLVD